MTVRESGDPAFDDDACPSVSIVIPTLNCAAALTRALESIAAQAYPTSRLEVIVADGGSKDATREVARAAGCTVVENPLHTGEAGKAAGLDAAHHDLVAFIDSDNRLPVRDWMTRIVQPFADVEILAAEPICYETRADMTPLNRYFALLGMNDPTCLFIGNYDRESAITGRWTSTPHEILSDAGSYIKVRVEQALLPTIGANGFVVRRALALAAVREGYLFDVDVLRSCDTSTGYVTFAKVRVGIVHDYVANLRVFRRKQMRRIRDYFYFRRKAARPTPHPQTRQGLLKFVGSTVLTIPLLFQAIRGFRHAPTWVWVYHPLVCWLTLATYIEGTLTSWRGTRPMERAEWSQ